MSQVGCSPGLWASLPCPWLAEATGGCGPTGSDGPRLKSPGHLKSNSTLRNVILSWYTSVAVKTCTVQDGILPWVSLLVRVWNPDLKPCSFAGSCGAVFGTWSICFFIWEWEQESPGRQSVSGSHVVSQVFLLLFQALPHSEALFHLAEFICFLTASNGEAYGNPHEHFPQI